MNVNAIINMIIRIVMRQLINRGIRGGMTMFGRRGKDQPPMTEADADQARRARQTAKNARQAMRATRRNTRF